MLLDDIAAYLLAQGVATQIGGATPYTAWPVFEGYFPDDTDQMMAVFETGGKPALTMNRENSEFNFQLRVRGARLNYAVTHAQWEVAFNALQDSKPTSAYALVQAMHYGPLVFNDDRGRTNLVSNFRVNRLTVGA